MEVNLREELVVKLVGECREKVDEGFGFEARRGLLAQRADAFERVYEQLEHLDRAVDNRGRGAPHRAENVSFRLAHADRQLVELGDDERLCEAVLERALAVFDRRHLVEAGEHDVTRDLMDPRVAGGHRREQCLEREV